MTKRAVFVFVAIALIVLVWWRRGDHHDTTATPATATASGSAGAPIATATVESTAPAELTIGVKDARGPLVDATVRLRPKDGEIITLRTGGDGIAHATALAPGEWAISASAIDHAPAAAPIATLHANDRAHVELVLDAGGKPLTGVVTDANGGAIAGARVDAALLDTRAKPADAVASTLTGSDGHYKLSVAEGQLVVAVSDPDYAPVARYVLVGAAGATADFSLVPGGAIEGIVRDEHTHSVVAGAHVEAHRDTAGVTLAETGTLRTATAGADGHFRIGGLPPGNYELGAQADTRSSKQPTLFGLGVAEQRTDLEVLIAAGPVVRGVVVDDAGAAVGGARVFAMAADDQEQATADPAGKFEITGAHAGRYRVFASSDVFLPAGTVEVVIAAKDIENVRVVVHRGAELHGHVEPRQIADVTIGGDARGDLTIRPFAPITTAADGTFTFHPVANGLTRLEAHTAGGASGNSLVTIGKDLGEVVIQLTPGASIAGHVVDGAGKPVATVTVVASSTADNQTTIVNGMMTSGVQTITNATGDYELRGLTTGSYVLRVLDRGHPLALRTKADDARVHVAEGEHKTGVELAVDRAVGTIKGTVVGADGAPLADAWVSVHQDLADVLAGLSDHNGGPGASGSGGPGGPGGDTGFMSVMTDDDDSGTSSAGATPPALTDASGHFEIGGLVTGKYQVVAEGQAGRVRGRASDVVPDATITITATAPTELAGTVHGVSGPTSLFSVELTGPTAGARSFSDPQGQFSFARVDPGAYVVHVTSADGAGDAPVIVVAGQRAMVDVTLVANAIVIGKLVDPNGAPVVGVPVTVVPDSHDGRVSVTMSGMPPSSGPDGRFRIETKAGEGVFVAMVHPRPVTQMGLKLVAGQTMDLGNVTIGAAAPPAPTPTPAP